MIVDIHTVEKEFQKAEQALKGLNKNAPLTCLNTIAKELLMDFNDHAGTYLTMANYQYAKNNEYNINILTSLIKIIQLQVDFLNRKDLEEFNKTPHYGLAKSIAASVNDHKDTFQHLNDIFTELSLDDPDLLEDSVTIDSDYDHALSQQREIIFQGGPIDFIYMMSTHFSKLSFNYSQTAQVGLGIIQNEDIKEKNSLKSYIKQCLEASEEYLLSAKLYKNFFDKNHKTTGFYLINNNDRGRKPTAH